MLTTALATLGAALLLALGQLLTPTSVPGGPPATLPLPPVAVPHDCAEPERPLTRAVWAVGQRRGGVDLSCGNVTGPLVVLPGGDPGRLQGSGFDALYGAVRGTERELLFATMQWKGQPGQAFVDALAELYAALRRDPAAYPEGMRVRLALGNDPAAPQLQWGAQVWTLLRQVQLAGLPLSDPEVGWSLSLANYAGTYPHSHVKVMVLDGTQQMVAGFNLSHLHLPRWHPAGGSDVFDLGLFASGPQSHRAREIFADVWERSRVMECLPGGPQGDAAPYGCHLGALGRVSDLGARGLHFSDLQPFPAGSDRVLTLYRRPDVSDADDAILAAIGASRGHIDLMNASFSMTAPCILALISTRLCPPENALPFMPALLDALERGVTVRLIVDGSTLPLHPETAVGLAFFRAEMARRGIPPGRFEARFYRGRMHAKAADFDGELLHVGSHNLHYSSWTQGFFGLSEAVVFSDSAERLAEFAALYQKIWDDSPPAALPERLERGFGRP